MRCVTFLLACFISFSNAQNLKLCDVSKAQKPLISVNQEYLLKTLYGPFVESYGASDKQFIPTNIHPFIYAAHKAYAEHRPLALSPDAVWMLITQGSITLIAQNPAKFKQYSEYLNSKSESFNGPVPSSKKEWLKLLDKVAENAGTIQNPAIRDFCTTSFSTTDSNISQALKISQLSSRSEVFQFGLFSLCGIPEIRLEGSVKDWQKIYEKLDGLESLGLNDWAQNLKPILKEFIEAASGQINKKFWNSFYKYNNECGDGSISGWILSFFPYNAKGKLRHLVKAHSSEVLNAVPDSDPNMSFPSGRTYLPFNWNYKKMRFEAGFMGVSQNPQTYELKAEINWAVIKNKASGNLSIWQQNVVREKTISKKMLSAAYSATYIDIENFVNEADPGLQNLTLLEYAIIKKPVKGKFLKELLSLPNFKELECYDWNIDKEFYPLIPKLKNKTFSFIKETESDFFKHLPETTDKLIFKGILIKKDYLSKISLAKLDEIYFENCRFEEGALSSLKSKIMQVKIKRCREISFNTLKEINSLQSLQSLSITSCKLKAIPNLTLPELKSLNLSSNFLSSTKCISKLSKLKVLNLAKNHIQENVNFDIFPNLEELIIHHNFLSSLKLELKNLSSLNASNNQLTELPLISSKQLKTLIVEKNNISSAEIPKNLKDSLETLVLENVHLSRENTKAIGSMTQLRELSLKNCSLVNADLCELEKLSNLKTLNIWTNRELTDKCKSSVIKLFSLGTNISIFDCGFSSSTMDEFAKHREKYN